MLHLKKIGGSNSSLFPVGYEVVGILVDAYGAELNNISSAKELYLKLPSTRFTNLPYQFSDGEILKMEYDTINTGSSVWKFTKVS